MPQVSVCIPTYNGAKYLGEAITSILQQTLTDFELIIVDDGSTDATEAIVKSFTDSRLRYFKNPVRLGLVGNWNRCVELATEPYFCLFHQDDIMLPTNLAEKVDVLAQNSAVGLVYSDVMIIDAAGQVTAKGWFYKTESETDFIKKGLNFFETLILGDNLICCPAVVARRECYQRLGGFDPQLPFTADWEMWLRIALFYDVAYLVSPLLQYRWHSGSETFNFSGSTQLEQHYRAKVSVLEKYGERVPNAPNLKLKITSYYERQAFIRALHHYYRQQYREAQDYAEMARQLPGHNFLKTVALKIAAEPGFRWLYHFRAICKKILSA
jgi:glycosyltransferase involved in cell wall biosynthesis